MGGGGGPAGKRCGERRSLAGTRAGFPRGVQLETAARLQLQRLEASSPGGRGRFSVQSSGSLERCYCAAKRFWLPESTRSPRYT
jgi:hypothetical protein